MMMTKKSQYFIIIDPIAIAAARKARLTQGEVKEVSSLVSTQYPLRRLSAKAEALRNKKCAQQPRLPLPQPEMLPAESKK